ncbi:glycoside hydrolase 64/thaumatin family protein [Thiocapsa marina]|uniref:Thaumatin pathogenesis-related protein n=1 Tax=Thiocapsa marina 5811 TaxID=768671 RepID=F9U7R2_9GAMM|nr:hypothetical protein [Thiocapsa marina]EGV19692.1 Thaumatin pathogenesis-related protein [Thiocapsa marina 5811]
MNNNPSVVVRPFRACACGALLLASQVSADPAVGGSCEAEVGVIAGDYIACLLEAHADNLHGEAQDPARMAVGLEDCDREHLQRYVETVLQDPASCPGAEESFDGLFKHLRQLHQGALGAVDQVALLVSGRSITPVAGKVILFNNCALPLKLMSDTNAAIDGNVLQAGEQETFPIGELHAGSPNTILVAPVTTRDQCGDLACEDWTAVQPNRVQREPGMWEDPNLTYAAYCQPTNAAAAQCSSDPAETPCCGPNMNYDKTFGTHLELTPDFQGQDFVNLSTNAMPPLLCGPGVDPNNCVTASANIFFNVPIHVDMAGGDCACDSLGNRSQLICTTVSCEDAYQYPLDPKQCACSSGGQRGYTVTYCPEGSPLPRIPSAS